MSEAKNRSEVKTRPLGDHAGPRLAIVHAIAHLRWDREWYEPFEVRRAKLLETLASLHEQMAVDSSMDNQFIRFFLLGGQTVVLEDVGAVRPDLVTMLVIYNAGGRLGLGPWYVTVDESLVSGEALIRNLLTARSDAIRYGLRLTQVAYVPDLNGHISQLPQILRGFNIDAAFLRHGAPVVHVPFRWEAPDGSSILVINHESQTIWPHTPMNIFGIADMIQAQRVVRPDGPFLWLFDTSHASRKLTDVTPKVEKQTSLPVRQSDLPEYVRSLRAELPDGMRPSLRGELRLQAMRENSYLLPGTLSSRIYLKQMNVQMQARLLKAIEPWLAVALTHGNAPHPENLRALLDYCWRMLLKNQARNALAGTGVDAVHAENEVRYQQIDSVSSQMITSIMNALPGTIHEQMTPVNPEQTYIVVWNAHNWPVRQMVEVDLELPPGKYPARLLSPMGEEQLYSWTPSEAGHGGRIGLIGEAPGIGYSAYVVEFGDEPPSERHHIRLAAGTAIANGAGDTLSVRDGVLVWHSGDEVIEDLLTFFDGGDAGDTYNYSPPDPDAIIQADLVDDVQVESSPLYERLIIRHRMRVASELKPDRSRDRGVKLIELTTTATFYEQVPGVYFRTTFTNTAKDHRMRAHIRTGINSRTVQADSAFDVVERATVVDGVVFPGAPNLEGANATQPIQNVVAVGDEKTMLALLVRGLPEYEPLPDDNQITFALTLLRSVGWLSRDDLRTRTALVAPMVPVPDAQCLRDIEAEYALMYMPPRNRAALLRAGTQYNAPLQAYQYDEPPDKGERSFLSVVSNLSIGLHSDGEGAIVTAFKPPLRGEGWIVRLYNPNNKSVEVYLTPHKRPELVQIATLAEQPEGFIESDVNGRAAVIVNPHEIVTVRFMFSAPKSVTDIDDE